MNWYGREVRFTHILVLHMGSKYRMLSLGRHLWAAGPWRHLCRAHQPVSRRTTHRYGAAGDQLESSSYTCTLVALGADSLFLGLDVRDNSDPTFNYGDISAILLDNRALSSSALLELARSLLVD